MAKTKTNPLLDPKTYRKEQGLSQTKFWGQYGVDQTTGSRYEKGRLMHLAIAMLITLHTKGVITQQAFERARLYALRDFADKPKELRFRKSEISKIDNFVAGADEYRRGMNMNKTTFWRMFGVGQSTGSRYDNGSNKPTPVIMLMALFIETLDLDKLEWAAKEVETTFGVGINKGRNRRTQTTWRALPAKKKG